MIHGQEGTRYMDRRGHDTWTLDRRGHDTWTAGGMIHGQKGT